MRRPVDLAALALAAGALLACGGRKTELVPPVGEVKVLDPDAPFPRLVFADGETSANDRCPVTKRKLSVHFPPVYVNGKPFGFC